MRNIVSGWDRLGGIGRMWSPNGVQNTEDSVPYPPALGGVPLESGKTVFAQSFGLRPS